MGSFGYAQDDREATFFVILSGTQWSRRIPQTESYRPMGSFGYAQDDKEEISE
jgi:hypothetical protein